MGATQDCKTRPLTPPRHPAKLRPTPSGTAMGAWRTRALHMRHACRAPSPPTIPCVSPCIVADAGARAPAAGLACGGASRVPVTEPVYHGFGGCQGTRVRRGRVALRDGDRGCRGPAPRDYGRGRTLKGLCGRAPLAGPAPGQGPSRPVGVRALHPRERGQVSSHNLGAHAQPIGSTAP